MSDYPMLISNKLHSFRNFLPTNIQIIYRIKEFVEDILLFELNLSYNLYYVK